MYKIQNDTYDEAPLLIVDFRVLCHKVYNLTEAANWLSVKDRHNYIKAAWAFLLNAGPSFVDCTKATVVIVDDNKSLLPIDDPCFKEGGIYWRNRELPKYKGNRPPKSNDFYSAANFGLKYVNKAGAKWSYLSLTEYEADDFAGAIVAHKRLAQAQLKNSYDADLELIANRPIILWTVDTDWLQLAGEGVYWANTGPWVPRLRYVEETIAYAKKSQTLAKQNISHPYDIVDVKIKFGDKADNIPAGSPRYLIDLINVPRKYNLRNKPIWELVLSCINKKEQCMNVEHYEKAKQYISSMGLTFPD